MPEMSVSENDELIARVYTQALEARNSGRELDEADLMVYHIEMLSQEVNSGASFEHYFRWAGVEEISEVVGRLEILGLSDVAELVRGAIEVAFPEGLPSSDDDKSELLEWTEDQEQLLSALADEFAEFTAQVTNALCGFYRKTRGGA